MSFFRSWPCGYWHIINDFFPKVWGYIYKKNVCDVLVTPQRLKQSVMHFSQKIIIFQSVGNRSETVYSEFELTNYPNEPSYRDKFSEILFLNSPSVMFIVCCYIFFTPEGFIKNRP